MQISRSTRDFLLGLYELRDPAEASTWIVNGMAKLFHAENAIICRHDGTRRIITAVVAKEAFSRANLIPAINESGLMAKHPFWEGTFLPGEPVRPLSAIASRKKWHANPLYNEVFRPDGIEDQLNTEVLGNPEAFTTVNILRSRWGFSTSEVALLNLLRDHISQALVNAQRLDEAGVFSISRAGAILIPLDYHGRPQTLDPAESNGPLAGLLAHRARLPDTVLEWIKTRVRILNSGALETRIAPFCHRVGNQILEYSIHRDLQLGSYRLLIVPGTATPDPLTTLSQREIEVLDWVEKGKSNEQISEILGLSQNTVKTFLKRAFIKLGVENRTAAASATRPPGGGSSIR